MPDHHFKPPQVPVDDVGTPAERAPVRVRNACALVLISLALGYLTLIPGVGLPWPDTRGEQMFVVAWLIGVTWLTYWLTLRVRLRSNRARWGLFVFLALTWLLSVDGLGAEFSKAPFSAGLGVFCVGIEMAAMLMLFSGSSARWFARQAK